MQLECLELYRCTSNKRNKFNNAKTSAIWTNKSIHENSASNHGHNLADAYKLKATYTDGTKSTANQS